MFSDVRMGKALEIEEAVSLVDEINQSMERNSNALLSLIRLKTVNEYTYLHSVAVCMLMVAVGRQLGLSGEQLRQAGVAGLLHDVGKMAIPSEVLDKPGKLTDDEFTIIKSHPQRGWEILKSCYQVHETALDVCLHHHERMDGQGYPEKYPVTRLLYLHVWERFVMSMTPFLQAAVISPHGRLLNQSTKWRHGPVILMKRFSRLLLKQLVFIRPVL